MAKSSKASPKRAAKSPAVDHDAAVSHSHKEAIKKAYAVGHQHGKARGLKQAAMVIDHLSKIRRPRQTMPAPVRVPMRPPMVMPSPQLRTGRSPGVSLQPPAPMGLLQQILMRGARMPAPGLRPRV